MKKAKKKSVKKVMTANQEEHLMDVINRSLSSRTELLEKIMDPRRNMDHECGFPVDDPTDDQYSKLYGRNPLAKKACDIKADHCWKSTPAIYENAEHEETEFEIAFSNLQKTLRIQNSSNEKGYYGGTDSSVIWDILKRADKMAARGRYSVVFLGFNDGLSPSEPVTKADNLELMYVTAYTSEYGEVSKWDNDINSPRYGKPELYKLGNTVKLSQSATSNVPNQQFTAHHSRVLHITHNPESAEAIHEPLLKVLFNTLHGSDKIIGSGPEAYFRMCFTHLVLKAMPGITKDDVDESGLKDQIYSYENSLQKIMTMFGFDVDQISPDIVDPTPFLDMLIELICIILECPKRIFMGSERGELASSQDKSSWNEVITERRINIVNSRMIIPFIEKLINLGVLPEPEQFHIEWENLDKMSEIDRVEIADKTASALVKYVQGDISSVMELVDFLTLIIGMDDMTAEAVVDRVMESVGKEDDESEPTEDSE